MAEPKDIKTNKVKPPVRQAPIVMKVDTGKPASSLPPLTPPIKPTPLAPLASYKTGTDYVPKDQLAVLHKGEKVIPKKDNPMAAVNPYDKITAGDKKPKKEIKEIRTRKSHDGKLIHTHVHHHPEHHADEEHVSTGMSDLHGHFENHAGQPNDGEAPPEGGAPAQLTASPSPMPAAAPAAGPTGA